MTQVNLRRYYEAINKAWAFVRDHEQIGSEYSDWQKYHSEFVKMCEGLDRNKPEDKVILDLYLTAYQWLQQAACQGIIEEGDAK